MAKKEVRIEKMTIRVHRNEKLDASSLGLNIAEQLSSALAGEHHLSGREEMNIKVTTPGGASGKELARLVASAIMKGLV